MCWGKLERRVDKYVHGRPIACSCSRCPERAAAPSCKGSLCARLNISASKFFGFSQHLFSYISFKYNHLPGHRRPARPRGAGWAPPGRLGTGRRQRGCPSRPSGWTGTARRRRGTATAALRRGGCMSGLTSDDQQNACFARRADAMQCNTCARSCRSSSASPMPRHLCVTQRWVRGCS